MIHFIWLGKSESGPDLPSNVQKYIDNCKIVMPDYEIRVWNSNDADFFNCRFAREAYEEGKYAFASDYIRLWVLYHYGGVYLDTDVKILRPLDDLLDNPAFIGFEQKSLLATSIIGSEKGNPYIKELMEFYEKERFVFGLGQYNNTPNTIVISNLLKKRGLLLNGEIQKMEYLTIYPMDYFCPYNPYRSPVELYSENTYVIHMFESSWIKSKTANEEKFIKKEKKFQKFLGKKAGGKLCRFIVVMKHLGLSEGLRHYFRKS